MRNDGHGFYKHDMHGMELAACGAGHIMVRKFGLEENVSTCIQHSQFCGGMGNDIFIFFQNPFCDQQLATDTLQVKTGRTYAFFYTLRQFQAKMWSVLRYCNH